MLKLEGLHAGYGDVRIIRDVGLEVSPGELVSIVGRNGVGKSTLLKAIVGLATVVSGKVSLRETSLAGLPTHLMASMGVGYVAQEREVCPHLSVQENLLVPLLAAGRSSAASSLSGVYDRFPRLRERSRQPAGSLSGGERKLLAFARIMLLQPSVYLIDEPTEGLMPAAVQEIKSLMRAMREAGSAVVLVEQNLSLVRELSSRVYLMNMGQTEQCVDKLDDVNAERYLGL
jgi:branched-chain amino acid transport system ATP-binding protein